MLQFHSIMFSVLIVSTAIANADTVRAEVELLKQVNHQMLLLRQQRSFHRQIAFIDHILCILEQHVRTPIRGF